MNSNDVLVLAKAGFTAQQIAALNNVGALPVPQAAQTGAPVLPTVNNNQFDLGTLQQSLLLAAQQPPVQTTDDILASIIAPDGTGGNK